MNILLNNVLKSKRLKPLYLKYKLEKKINPQVSEHLYLALEKA